MKSTLTALLLFASTTAEAAGINGNDLMEWCEGSPGMAMAYSAAVFELTPVLTIKLTCPTSGITAQQAADVLCKHVKDNPASRNQSGATLALIAFRDAWPCP